MEEKPTPKEKLYKTAYSHLFKCYVQIDVAFQNDRGEWIFKCSNVKEGLFGCMFTERELGEFVL